MAFTSSLSILPSEIYFPMRFKIVELGTNFGVKVSGSIKENLLFRDISIFCTKENVRLINSFGRIFPIFVLIKSNVLLYFGCWIVSVLTTVFPFLSSNLYLLSTFSFFPTNPTKVFPFISTVSPSNT